MNALRMYLTPQAKKQRLMRETAEEEDQSDLLSEGDGDAISEPAATSLDDKLEKQENMMNKMMDMMADLSEQFKDFKNELSHVRLQAGIAQESAEEALERVAAVEERIDDMETRIMSKCKIQEMIDESLKHLRDAASYPLPGATSPTWKQRTPYGADEKFARTVVIGGFVKDTPRGEVKDFIEKWIVGKQAGVDEVYAYMFGNVGFVRFLTDKAMWDFLKEANQRPKPKFGEKEVWISVSKSPAERKKAKTLGRFKRVLIESGLSVPLDVQIDYRRGLVFLRGARVAEWNVHSDEHKLIIDEENLKQVGVDVEAPKLEAALDELMRQ